VGGRLIRVGVLTPHAAIGPEAEFPAMARGRIETIVVRVTGDRGAGRPMAARHMTDAGLDKAADGLAAKSVAMIAHASTSYAYAAGFAAEMAMVARLSQRVGIPVAATCSSAVLALRTLGVSRVALVHPPWFDGALNELGTTYFRSQGVGVVSSASADLPNDPRRIDPDAVCAWTSHHVGDDAEAVFIGGNGFRSADAIAGLESAIQRPVVTSNQALLWNLLAEAGVRLEVTGYGRLFAQALSKAASRT
jgi:maleate isomerase